MARRQKRLLGNQVTAVISFLPLLLMWGPPILLASAAAVGLYLFLSFKVELRVMAKRAVSRPEVDARWRELSAELETLRTRLAEIEARPLPAALDSVTQSVNLNRRGQILRLHGKGRTASEIASDLQISQGEVELLLKVHDLPASPAL